MAGYVYRNSKKAQFFQEAKRSSKDEKLQKVLDAAEAALNEARYYQMQNKIVLHEYDILYDKYLKLRRRMEVHGIPTEGDDDGDGVV